MSYNYEFRSPKANQKTNIYRALRLRTQPILEGRMLVLDPSIGSMSSEPGYAIFEAGVLVDSGTITMPTAASTPRRLFYLGKCLREQFTEKFNCVVIEDIPALRFNKFGRSLQSQLPLHYSAAVCMSSFDCELVLEVSPATWRSFASEQHLEDKRMGARTDEQDAIAMGWSVIEIAKYAAANPVKRGRRARSTTNKGKRKKI